MNKLDKENRRRRRITNRYKNYMMTDHEVFVIYREESDIPVRRRVLLRHAKLTIKAGPKIGWKVAII